MNHSFNSTAYRLAKRILTGDVVFFIGAGFSIDSEGNTAQRFVSFLLVRFVAIILYLETLGFDNEEIMAGDTAVEAIDLPDKFMHRIRERHLVLARLAREGLCPTILTTNYDLLIEGGLSLIGFHPIEQKRSPSNIPPMTNGIARSLITPTGHAGGWYWNSHCGGCMQHGGTGQKAGLIFVRK